MATSIQTFGPQAQAFKDLDLLVLVCLLARQLDSAPTAYRAVAPFVAKWKQASAVYGPGTIDLELDELATSENAKLELLDLLRDVGQTLGQSGATIPSSILNSECRVPGVHFAEYPTSLLSAAIASLTNLLVSSG